MKNPTAAELRVLFMSRDFLILKRDNYATAEL